MINENGLHNYTRTMAMASNQQKNDNKVKDLEKLVVCEDTGNLKTGTSLMRQTNVMLDDLYILLIIV